MKKSHNIPLTVRFTGPYFTTPAGLTDYRNEENYKLWSSFISDSINDTIEEEEKTVGSGKCQFYNPEIKPAGSDKDKAIGRYMNSQGIAKLIYFGGIGFRVHHMLLDL